jgi:hypothetical protein
VRCLKQDGRNDDTSSALARALHFGKNRSESPLDVQSHLFRADLEVVAFVVPVFLRVRTGLEVVAFNFDCSFARKVIVLFSSFSNFSAPSLRRDFLTALFTRLTSAFFVTCDLGIWLSSRFG